MYPRQRLQLVRQVALAVSEERFRDFLEVSGDLQLERFYLLRILQEKVSNVIGCKPLLFLFGGAQREERDHHIKVHLGVSRDFCGDSADDEILLICHAQGLAQHMGGAEIFLGDGF